MTNLLRETPVPEYAAWKNRQGPPPAEYSGGGQFGYQNRDSPAPPPLNRPLSPYTGGRPPGYRQSSIRPGSSGSYEPPPAVYTQGLPPPPQAQYGGHAPPPAGYDAPGAGAPAGAWPPYPPPPGYGGQPPPPQLGYGQAPPPLGGQGGYARYPGHPY
jgi:cleavage stimulation factor subunit 3